MKTERIIKQRARAALKGNILPMIASMGFCALTFMFIEYMSYVPMVMLGIADSDGEINFSGSILLILAVMGLRVIAMALAAPLFNGFLRSAGNAAMGRGASAKDVFYYFGSARLYFKTVALDVILFTAYALISYGLDVYRYVSGAMDASLDNGLALNVETAILLAALLASVAVKLILYMLFLHYPLFAYALNDHRGVGFYVFKLIGFSCLNFGSVFKLFIGYLGWILLCFLVVPVMYVAPYLATGAALSAKWLFELDRNRGIV